MAHEEMSQRDKNFRLVGIVCVLPPPLPLIFGPDDGTTTLLAWALLFLSILLRNYICRLSNRSGAKSRLREKSVD
jgi:uncharacterized membrane protein